MSIPPKGYTIPPDQDFSTLYSDIIKTNSVLIDDTISFFGPGNIPQQSSDFTIEDVYKLLMNYGLVTPQTWVIESTHLNGLASVNVSAQGNSVAISEDDETTAEGGPDDDDGIGATWVFLKTGASWYQQSKLVGTGATGLARQGFSISMSQDGSNIVSSGPDNDGGIGASWVFTRLGDVWSQQAILIGTGNDGNSKQGTSVAISDDANTIAIGGPDDGGNLGATWIFIKSGVTWTQQAKLIGTGNIGNSKQGSSLAITSDGDILAIGGPGDNGNIGAVWIFTRSGVTWTQQTKLIGTGNTENSFKGASLDITFDGNLLIFGGPGDNGGIGAVWVFMNTGTAWVQQAKLVGSGNIGNSAQGTSVAIQTEGNMVVSGGPNDNNGIGAFWTWMYSDQEEEWQQSRDKIYSTLYYGIPNQGYSLSFHGETVIVGGPGDNSGIGTTWIYSLYANDNANIQYNTYYTIPKSGNYSSITSELLSPRSMIVGDELSLFGSKFNAQFDAYPTVDSIVNVLRLYGFVYTGYFNNQQSGPLVGLENIGNSKQGTSTSLSSDGNTTAIGGPNDDGDLGATWIFTRTDNVWTQQTLLVGSGNTGNSKQGTSISLSSDGNTLAVGGPDDDGGVGATWVFTRTGTVWTQQSMLIGTGNTGNSKQGTSVSMSSDGDTLVVGGPDDDGGVGATWVFTRTGTVWTQQLMLIGTDNNGNSKQGTSTSLSADGNTLAVGGPDDDGDLGATWIFIRSDNIWTQQSMLIGTDNNGNSKQGMSISLSFDGNTLAIGGPDDDGGVGATWVFTRTGTVWTQQTVLIGTEYIGSSQQGNSVSLNSDGNTLAIGGYMDNTNIGAVWVFTRTGTTWTQPGKKLQGTRGVYNIGSMLQGTSVTISSNGNTILFGGTSYNNDTGAFWVYIN